MLRTVDDLHYDAFYNADHLGHTHKSLKLRNSSESSEGVSPSLAVSAEMRGLSRRSMCC